MKVKSESEVTQLCPTLSDPVDCSPPGSSIHGILQARILEWVAIAFSSDPLKISWHSGQWKSVFENVSFLMSVLPETTDEETEW